MPKQKQKNNNKDETEDFFLYNDDSDVQEAKKEISYFKYESKAQIEDSENMW